MKSGPCREQLGWRMVRASLSLASCRYGPALASIVLSAWNTSRIGRPRTQNASRWATSRSIIYPDTFFVWNESAYCVVCHQKARFSSSHLVRCLPVPRPLKDSCWGCCVSHNQRLCHKQAMSSVSDRATMLHFSSRQSSKRYSAAAQLTSSGKKQI